MTNPWDRNAGKFDRPSSGLPGRALRAPSPAPAPPPAEPTEGIALLYPTGFAIIDRATFQAISAPKPIASPREYDDRPGRRIRRRKPE